MKLNPNDYSVHKPYIKMWIDNKGAEFDYLHELAYIAIGTGVPVIVVSYIIGELYGFTDEIKSKIESDMVFYRVTELTGYTTKQGDKE